MAYCLLNFQCILYNTPPLILSSELDIELPCREAEWRASTADSWTVAWNKSGRGPLLQASFTSLFSTTAYASSGGYSSLGSYVLIHALIQHIFFLRQAKICRPVGERCLLMSDVLAVEKALENWRQEWERSPESSLDPKDPHGPVAFNSTALLRIAYIRLCVDMGFWRALKTEDPVEIARAIFQSPPVVRSRVLTRAALHCAHALSIPMRLGVNLVERNQVFTWSVQHSVCSLECACLLSKWLDAVTTEPVEPCLADDELRLLRFVALMLEEVASNEALIIQNYPSLSVDVVRVWSNLFRGERVWDAVGLTNRALSAYEAMLERSFEGNPPVTRATACNAD